MTGRGVSLLQRTRLVLTRTPHWTSRPAVSWQAQRPQQLKLRRRTNTNTLSLASTSVRLRTASVRGGQALDLVKEVGGCFAAITHEPRSTAFLRQRMSVAVRCGNVYCVLGWLNSSNTGPLRTPKHSVTLQIKFVSTDDIIDFNFLILLISSFFDFFSVQPVGVFTTNL